LNARLRALAPSTARAARRVAALAALALLAVVVAVPSASGKQSAGGTFTLGITIDPFTLDWQIRATPSVINYMQPAYDTLVSLNPDETKILPYLATSWKQSPTARPKQIVFQLRKDAKCDGKQLTPLDVLNSMKRFLNVPKLTNGPLNFFGRGPYHLHADMKKWTFTFRSETPFINMLYGFAQTGIVCPSGIAAWQKDPHALETGQYGGGPYVMQSFAHNGDTVWKKRPDWSWGPPGVKNKDLPDTLVYKVIADATTMANLLITGGLDAGTVNGADAPRLIATPSLAHKTAQNYAMTSLVFNQTGGHPLTQDDKVRAAIMSVVDANKAVQVALNGRGVVAPSLLFPKMPCYDKKLPSIVPKVSVTAARQLLQSDGFAPNSSGIMVKDGKPLTVTLLTNASQHGGLGEYLQSQLQQAGIDVNLQNLVAGLWSAAYTGGRFDVAVSSSSNYVPYQGYNMAVFTGPAPTKGSNFGLVGGGAHDYDQAALLATQHTDCGWWNKFQQATIKSHAMLPLYFPTDDVFGSKSWSWPPNTNAFLVYWLKPTK
jgi:peptide/nickel transport system substrate-binding protein